MKRLRLALAAALSLPLTACTNNNPAVPPPTPSGATTQQVVDTYVIPFLQTNQAHGAIVGVSQHGVRQFFAYGATDERGTPFSASTVVEIGSCTKVFTTTLAGIAFNSGTMLPNGPAQPYMPPGYTLADTTLTPLALADFHSGMPDSPPNLPDPHDITHYTTANFLTWASTFQPVLPTTYVYSNAGIGLLGYMLEQANSSPWQSQLASRITGPLSMPDTVITPSPDQQKRLASGYNFFGGHVETWPTWAWFAAGVLRSTAQDMLNFGEANLGHTTVAGKAVPATLLAGMATAQHPIYPIPNTTDIYQAMSWVNGTPSGLDTEIWKNGGTDGFSSVIVLNPAKDVAIFIALNQGGTEEDGDFSNPTAVGIEIGRHLAP